MTSPTAVRPALWPWLLGFAFLVGIDQLTKYWVRSNFVLGESIPVIGELLRFTYVQNPGVAFGMQPFSPAVLIILGSAAAIALCGYFYYLLRDNDHTRWPVFLFLCGAIGNLIDRAHLGSVTDFADADFPDFIMDRWPVFNIADSCVTIGIVILIWQTLLVKKPAPLPQTSGERLDSSSLSSAGSSGTEAAPVGPLPDSGAARDIPK